MKHSFLIRTAVIALLFVSSVAYAGNNLQLMLDSVKSGTVLYVGANIFTSDVAYRLENKRDVIIVFDDSCKVYCSTKIENVFEIQNCNRVQIINGKFKHELPEEGECSGSVFYVNKSKNISIINCNINGSGAQGVNASATTNLTIQNCYLHHNSLSAYFFGTDCKNITLSENTLNDNGPSGNVSFEVESYTAPESEITMTGYSDVEKTEYESMLLAYKNVLDTIKDGDFITAVNAKAQAKLLPSDISTRFFPAEILNNTGRGYTDKLWLIPSDNLVEYYTEKSKLKSFDMETASHITNVSELQINSITPKAIVRSVESNELFLTESFTTEVALYKIPELDSILSNLRGKNQLIVAAQRDKIINEVLKVRREYVTANKLYQNTKFEIPGNAYFNINNYDVNEQALSIHLSINCVTETYRKDGVYIATVKVHIPLDKASKLFSIFEEYNNPVSFKVQPGFSRKGLGIAGGGLNRWEIPNMIVLEDPVINLSIDNEVTKIQIQGLKGELFPISVDTSRWDLHRVYQPRSEYIRNLLGVIL